MTKTERISNYITRVLQKRHDEHAKIPGDKRKARKAELRNNSLEDV